MSNPLAPHSGTMKYSFPIMLILCLLVVVWLPVEGEGPTEYEHKREPVVYSRKIPSASPQTMAALGGSPEPDQVFKAWVTAYNPTVEQCNSNPMITASGERVKEGIIACPRWIPFGTQVELNGQWYECQDRMSQKMPFRHRFDIFMWSKEDALEWGKQYKKIKLYYEEK